MSRQQNILEKAQLKTHSHPVSLQYPQKRFYFKRN